MPVTERLLSMSEEQKIKVAVRAISGEPLRALAMEFGVSEEVIQGWVDRVADIVEDNKVPADADLEKQIALAKGECNRLKRQIDSRKKQIEMRETELRMLSECPPFMRGGGRR